MTRHGAIAFVALCGLQVALADPVAPAKLVLSGDRLVFDDPEAPITLNVTFINTSSNAFVICTNRIDCQNSLLTVVTRPGVEPISIKTNWYSIPQHIADYFHGDAEGYVTVAPGTSYTHKEMYFTGKHHYLRHLLDFARGPWPPEDGDYIVRVYFWGAKCPVFDAPPDVAPHLLKAKLASNPITITLKRK